MGNQDIEPRGVAAVWPLAERGRNQVAVPPAEYPDYRAPAPTELTLATLWQIVWEWRWLILSAVAAGLALAVIATLLTRPLYRSTALIEISPPAVEVMDQKTSRQDLAFDDSFIETQTGVLASRALAERVSQDLNLPSNEVLVGNAEADRPGRQRTVLADLKANLTVNAVDRSRLIKIAYSSPDPGLAARVINGFADGYIASSLERRYQASSYARDFLQRQIANVRRELEASERQLVAYAQRQGIITTGGGSIPGQSAGDNDANSLTGSSLVELNRALADATTRRIQAEQAYRQSQSGRSTAEMGERTSTLRTERAKLQADYQDKLAVFKPDYPEMVRLKSRIDALGQGIAAEERDVATGRSGTLAADYQAALAAESALRGRVSGLKGQVLDLRGRSIQYNILRRDVDTNRSLYDALLQKYKEIGVAGGIGTSFASIVDRGDAPAAPYKPNLIFNLLIGLGLGLAAGLGIALVLEFVNDTIKTPDDVRNRLRLAFLGGIPVLQGNRPVDALGDPRSPITEAFFSTGTSLGFTTEEGAPRSLLLTSTRPAEGKSTSAWALAQYFARVGKSVLLIDADLRKPAFVTGQEKEDGLSNLLTNRDAVRPHVIQTDIENLWLLPCGPIPPNPAELLASSRMQAIINEAVSEFDMVIVDGPPILGLADAPLLSTACRGTLMVVEAGKTRTRAAVEALNRMRAAGATVIGCILMRYRHEASGYGYNYEAYTYKSVESRHREIRALAGAQD